MQVPGALTQTNQNALSGLVISLQFYGIYPRVGAIGTSRAGLCEEILHLIGGAFRVHLW
jgi:hypothetical protein